MYLFCVDESGTHDPDVGRQVDGTYSKSWLFVLTAIGLRGNRWEGFYETIVRRKRQLLSHIEAAHGVSLDLHLTEIKSNWVRVPQERAKHPFLSRLSNNQIEGLVDLYFAQLAERDVTAISVVIDKRELESLPGLTSGWVYLKAWECLHEDIEIFMREQHPDDAAVLVVDDCGRGPNRRLAMQHSRHVEKAISLSPGVNRIVEMPLFVRSELCEGVQLTDLCAYSIHRAFRDGNLQYKYSRGVLARTYRGCRDHEAAGLRILPPSSPLCSLLSATRTPNEKGAGQL